MRREAKVLPSCWYDYTVQAWMKDGIVARCGHRAHTAGCYACDHAGEVADPTHFEAN